MDARDFLSEIILHKKNLLNEKKVFFSLLKEKICKEKMTRYHLFEKAISNGDQIHLIAEIKKASPSKGILRADFSPLQLARLYVENGASAVSVLTEEKYFLGKHYYMKTISEQFPIPILAKDFFIDEVQIYEAFYHGASAILLIVGILDENQLRYLMQTAQNLDLDCIIEVHHEEELDCALKAGAKIIGINNRDLHSFEVNLETSRRLIPQIPKDKLIVVESGITSFREIKQLHDQGAHAVLIGETLLKACDIGQKIRELMHGQS